MDDFARSSVNKYASLCRPSAAFRRVALGSLAIGWLLIGPPQTALTAGAPASSVLFEIAGAFPHDPQAYTQGLLYWAGHLYESTGKYGRSSVRQVALDSGEVRSIRPLADDYFGEGLTRHGDRLYQLTWKGGRGFVYDIDSLEPVGDFRYDGQGWGLTSDERWLYMSDGSASISVRDPEDFSEIRRLRIHQDGVSVSSLNELEFIEGKIWANIYRSPWIVIFDPASGEILARLDLSRLVDAQDRRADVLNGIAYDPSSRRIFVTGKFWSTLYEIRLLAAASGTASFPR